MSITGYRHGSGVHQLRPAPGGLPDGAYCHRRQPVDQALGVGPDAPEQEFYRQALAQRPAELLAASRNLANYIRHSLQQERHPVWIAQREARRMASTHRARHHQDAP
jgi:hypothetical protein